MSLASPQAQTNVLCDAYEQWLLLTTPRLARVHTRRIAAARDLCRWYGVAFGEPLRNAQLTSDHIARYQTYWAQLYGAQAARRRVQHLSDFVRFAQAVVEPPLK